MTNVKTLSDVAPDAVIFSEGWPTEPERTPALLDYMDAQHFGMLACFQTASFGRVELWTRNAPATHSEPQCEDVCNPRTGCP
jgi:hypothetical protein